MAKCDFCKGDLLKGTGKMYVKKDGKILYFCSSKCQKNTIQLKRNPRKFKWTGAYDPLSKTVRENKVKNTKAATEADGTEVKAEHSKEDE